MAIVASRKGRLRRLAEHGDQAARKALDLASSPDKFLPTVQIGITLVGTLAAAYGGSQVVSNIASWLVANGPPAVQPVAESVALTAFVVLLSFCTLLFGGTCSKAIGIAPG